MSENLRDRYAEAIIEARTHSPAIDGWERACADAVLAVRDDALAEKDAEIERLRGIVNAQKADGGWGAHKRRLQADLRDLRFKFGKVCSERDAAEARLREENAGLRETVGRVEALLTAWGEIPDYDTSDYDRGRVDQRHMAAEELAAALAPRESATEAPRTPDGEQGGEREVGGIAAIAAERWRQIDEEGYTAEHDEHHSVRQFVATALAYLGAPNRAAWPIKRADPESGYFQRRDLVKAGALVAAAIDRLDAEESR